jgi:4-amino-4-deoxy-L-arabinose transferase-like glycosyltransferase
MLARVAGGDGWGWAVRILAPLGAFLLEGWVSALAAGALQESGLWLAKRIGGLDQRAVVSRLFLAGYGVRVAVIMPTHYVARIGNGNGALFQDDYTNDIVALWLVRIAHGEGLSVFPGHQHLLESGYTYLLAAIYAVIGYAPLVPKLLNAAISAVCVVLVYEIARRAFRPSAALIAAVIAVALPSLLAWSIATLKEPVVLLVILLALRALQDLTLAPGRSAKVFGAALVLGAILLVGVDLRASAMLILLVLGLVAVVARLQARPHLVRVSLGSLLAVSLLAGGLWVGRSSSSGRPALAVIEDITLELRHRRAQEAASARSQIGQQVEVISPQGRRLQSFDSDIDAASVDVMRDVVDPLGFALFAPAPWQAQSRRDLAASAEMLVWYLLLAAGLLGWRSQPQQRLFLGLLVLYGIGNWLILAASEGNLGNLLRHRLTLLPTELVFGAAGLDWLWSRFVAQRLSGMPALVRGHATG